MVFSYMKYLKILEVLDKYISSIYLPYHMGVTPLMMYAKNRNIHFLTYFLSYVLTVNVWDSRFNVALHYTTTNGWARCIREILVVVGNSDGKCWWDTLCFMWRWVWSNTSAPPSSWVNQVGVRMWTRLMGWGTLSLRNWWKSTPPAWVSTMMKKMMLG